MRAARANRWDVNAHGAKGLPVTVEQRAARPCVAVTGAGGFLGRSICKALSGSADVVVLGREKHADLPYPFRQIDLDGGVVAGDVLDGVDSVVHSAGIAHVFRVDAAAAGLMDRVNGGAVGLLARQAARCGVKRFVLISSAAVYGGPGDPLVDESWPCRPVGPYGESKYKGERLAAEALAGQDTALSIIRPVTIYGEGERGNLLRLIRTIDSGRFVWIGRGTNAKSLIHVEDAGRGCALAAMDLERKDGLWNLGGGVVTMREIVDCIARALNRRPPRLAVPEGLARLGATVASLGGVRGRSVANTVTKWLSHDAYDCGAFQRQYSFEPGVALEEGVRREVKWYQTAPRRPA